MPAAGYLLFGSRRRLEDLLVPCIKQFETEAPHVLDGLETAVLACHKAGFKLSMLRSPRLRPRPDLHASVLTHLLECRECVNGQIRLGSSMSLGGCMW